MEEYVSELDTLRFGFRVAKINRFDEEPESVLRRCREARVALVISRVATADVRLINAMEEAGFRFKDVQVTYNFDLGRAPIPATGGDGCDYRAFRPADADAIIRIAAQSFRNYGHYSLNDRTRSVDSSVIYEDWARRSCLDAQLADHIVVAQAAGEVAGFLSLKVREEEGGKKYAAGVMGAVHENFRKGGVFRGINVESLRWAQSEGIARVENNVIVTNFPVNGTYAALGFRIIRTDATFHCWLG